MHHRIAIAQNFAVAFERSEEQILGLHKTGWLLRRL